MDIQKLKKQRIQIALKLAQLDQKVAFYSEEISALKAKIKERK